MKTIMLRTAMALTIATLCYGTLWAAGDGRWVSATDQPSPVESPATLPDIPASPFQNEDAVKNAVKEGNFAGPAARSEHAARYQDESASDWYGSGIFQEDCAPACEHCPRLGVVGLWGLDSFHGVSDSFLQGNFGTVVGLNGGGPLPGLERYGIGWQVGATYGVYDWDGRAEAPNNNTIAAQQQTFITAGFFRKADTNRRMSFGLVYDWMINDNWGIFTVSPTLGQWRAQFEYALDEQNSFGVYGTIREHSSTAVVLTQTIVDQPVEQVNLFWHHKFCWGADTRLWLGVPDHTKLNGPGSLGEFIIGGNVEVPLSRQLAVYANAQYMRPTAKAGPVAEELQGYDIGVGIAWYPARNARTKTINGSCWTPYMPMANNANFLVDQSPTVVPAPN